MIPLGISYASPADYDIASQYQQIWGYPLLTDEQTATIRLHISDGRIQIIAPHISRHPYQHSLTPYLQASNLKQHPLRQAIGSKRRNCLIYDLTAGLLKDSISLALLGHRVIAVEQHPVIFAISAQAWQAQQDTHPELALQLHHAAAEHFMTQTPTRPDIVYLDPMFPARSKSALVKKPMQFLQAIIGSGCHDYSTLLEQACQYATGKVIVKRPSHGAPLAGRKPAMQYSHQQSTRYDIYYVD